MVKLKAKYIAEKGVEMDIQVEGYEHELAIECISIIVNSLEIVKKNCKNINKEEFLNDLSGTIEEYRKEDWNDGVDLQ